MSNNDPNRPKRMAIVHFAPGPVAACELRHPETYVSTWEKVTCGKCRLQEPLPDKLAWDFLSARGWHVTPMSMGGFWWLLCGDERVCIVQGRKREDATEAALTAVAKIRGIRR